MKSLRSWEMVTRDVATIDVSSVEKRSPTSNLDSRQNDAFEGSISNLRNDENGLAGALNGVFSIG